MSRREEYEQKTEEILQPIIDANGFELVDVEYVKEGGNNYLRIVIDRDEIIDVDKCVEVTRVISPLLDDADLISDSYILDVCAKIEDIKELLQMPYWNDARYKNLLTSSVAAKSKQMITKLPVLFEIAEYYKIDGYLNTTFLLFSPSQNFALINYLNDNNIPLIENDKLNKVFGKQPGFLKKKYGIDIKEQMLKYDFSKFSFNGDTKKGGSKNAVR